jgi:hypothetical protein
MPSPTAGTSASEELVAKVVGEFAADHDPARERGWIAEVGGRLAGSIFCVAEDEETARLRLLIVEPWARGLGVGAGLGPRERGRGLGASALGRARPCRCHW